MNTVTILLATLAIGLVATGTAYTTTAEPTLEDTLTNAINQYYGSTSEPITQSRDGNPQSSHVSTFCIASKYDPTPSGTNQPTTDATCTLTERVDGQYFNRMDVNQIYYEIGDTLLVKAYQDLADTNRATQGLIRIDDVTDRNNIQRVIAYGFPSNDIALQLKLDNKFTANKKYTVSSIFDTTRAAADEAISIQEFHVVPSTTTGSTPPPPPPPPPPEMTGVKGKIYTDTNNNNRLDPGERGRAGIEVITVSLSNHSDVQRMRTDANGDFTFERNAGGYLLQAIGGGPNSYAYITIPNNTMLVQNLAY